MQDQNKIVGFIFPKKKSENGSTQNGTVRERRMLAAIENLLYLCNAFETQVQNIEY